MNAIEQPNHFGDEERARVEEYLSDVITLEGIPTQNSRVQRMKAAVLLVEQLRGFATHGFVVRDIDEQTMIGFDGLKGTVFLRVEDAEVRMIHTADATQSRTVPLRYNVRTGRFEGFDVDEEVAPRPGEIRPREPAALVVIRAAVEFLRELSTPG